MLFWGIMGDEGRVRKGRKRRGNEVRFGGVKVAAAGVDTEGPGGEPGGLPGGEGEGIVEELRDGGRRERLRRRRKRKEERRVERVVGLKMGERRKVLKREEGTSDVAAKGVGLVLPIETVWSTSIAIE